MGDIVERLRRIAIITKLGGESISIELEAAARIEALEKALKPFDEAERAHSRHMSSGRSGLSPSHWTTYDDFQQASATLEVK